MLRNELTEDDKKRIDTADILEDMMLTHRGYQIIREWLDNAKSKADRVESIDLKLSAEEIKILIAVNQTKRKMIEDLEKFIINSINLGKDLKMRLLTPGQEGETNERV